MTADEGGVLALIPARSGSRAIPDKNIRDFHGKPLLAHSIEQARACPLIDRVIVSTDSERYAEIARRFGAETPFLRPAGISGDGSTDLECFQHALRWLTGHEGAVPAICVHLRPTHPNRTPEQIAQAIMLLQSHPDWDSLRSVTPAPEPPFKMWFPRGDGTIEPAATCALKEAHSLPRQLLPQAYVTNGNVDVIRSRTILEKGMIAGDRVGAFVMKESHDIDTQEQFHRAEAAFQLRGGAPTGKTFCVDIDGVIATILPGGDYAQAEPLGKRIEIINRLRERGNRIVLFTGRDSRTGIDWRETTRRQLDAWGLGYDELRFGKPAADYYIDDRMLSLAELDAFFDADPPR